MPAGPSGCGKTTVLRAIAGFEPVHAGSIRLGGVPVSAPGLSVPLERRGIGRVFQDFVRFSGHLDYRPGSRVWIRIDAEHLVAFVCTNPVQS